MVQQWRLQIFPSYGHSGQYQLYDKWSQGMVYSRPGMNLSELFSVGEGKGVELEGGNLIEVVKEVLGSGISKEV